ncbi:acyl-CoA dehydrogenase family protein [Streptomyces sp. NPDC048172]|uniref:acyl-CoA dehydrogenase family protein n=1 Tax=Streptomyces sp. NPDC048172 TaxID=3365505 RepID=UPI00372095F0
MDFRLTDDQEALRRGTRELMDARFGRDALRRAVDDDSGSPRPDRALWRELGEAGFFSLALPEAEGGVGLGLPESVLVLEEAGRALLPGPLVASRLAAGLVPGAADGTVVVTALELAEGLSERLAEGPVEHLEAAGRVLVLDGDGPPRTVAPEALRAEPVRSVDPLSPLHRVTGAVTGTVTGTAEDGEVLEGVDGARLRREGALLTAAQQLGSAGRTVEMAVGYAREREQFGQPIGAFQAVKHLCAEMLVRTETARSVVYAAALTEDEGETAAAKLLADEAAVRNARDCLQVHGGMGFTWEADVHLHLKRAWLRARQWQRVVTAEEKLAAVL